MTAEPEAKVWCVSGNDETDDPAWGASPVRIGTPAEIAEWLSEQHMPETLSVTLGSRTLWAAEFLAERGVVARTTH
jgi:hypothetical protein